MPKKTCPKCSKQHGTRKKVCDCGHSFGGTGGGVEPGGWVGDPTKGMPKIDHPGPLPEGTLSVEEVQDQIAYHGLGYCLWDYIPVARIRDAKLQTLWRGARRTMLNIVEHLE
jgi:hypothetical protein